MQTPSLSASRALILLAACLAFAAAPAHAVLLEYWDFNNDSRVINNSTLGTFSTDGTGVTSATGNGEIFNTTTKTLTSNTAYGALNGTLTLSGSLGTYGGVTSSAPSWGVYTNSSGSTSITNLPTVDTTTGGSLVFVTSGAATDTLTFTLSSAGYSSLTLSAAERLSNSSVAGVVWEYSLDGSTGWTTLTPSGGPGNGNFAALSMSLPSALDNLGTLYVRETVNFSAAGSFAIDNVQLNGTALAVPEPSTWALLLAGGGLLAWSARRRLVAAKVRA